MLSPFGRASFVLKHDQTLGTIAERLAGIHGDRRMVEEADGGLRLTFAQAAKRVNRWAGGIAAQVKPGDAVVIATPNGYEQCCSPLPRRGPARSRRRSTR